jgi:adenylate cyclase
MVHHGPRIRLLRGTAIGLGAFLFVAILTTASFFETIERKSLDWRFRTFSRPEEASNQIVLVVVDQASLDYYEAEQGLPWPWPRGLYEAVISFCQEAGVRAIAFDILFTERSGYGYEDDAVFGEAIDRAGNVYLAAFLSQKERAMDPDVEQFFLHRAAMKVTTTWAPSLPEMQSAVLSVEEVLVSCRGLGNVTFAPDEDGIYRRLALVSPYKGKFIPSLPLAVAAGVMGIGRFTLDPGALRLGDLTIPLDQSGQMLVKYYGPAGTYQRYPIANVIQSQVRLEMGEPPIIPLEAFRDRIVLVGLTAPGLYDLKPTPFSNVYPGTEVHATALDNILHGDFMVRVDRGWLWVTMLLLSLGTGMGISWFSQVWKGILVLAIAVVLPLLLAVLAFRSGIWFDLVPVVIGVFLAFASGSVVNFSTEGRQKRFIRGVFQHYLSPTVIDQVMQQPERLKLGGERKELTVLFSDVAGFTTVSESLDPEELTLLLNEYLSLMTEIILDTGGTLDKYEGDAIIAFWGAPLDQPDHAVRACRAALRCQRRLAELRESLRERGLPELFARIGINSGPMIVGNMGSASRFDYTVMGDSVNLGSRLESANKQYGTTIMIGESTYALARDEVIARELDLVRVKGKAKGVRVYELMGLKGEVPETQREIATLYEQGLALYRERRFQEAHRIFSRLTEDPPSRIFLNRCNAYLKSPPPEDWDGTYQMAAK